MLVQHLYISTAPSLLRSEVDAILDASVRNNSDNDITGLLLYNGRNFLQLLEGEGDVLKHLMMRIANDRRHTGLSVLGHRPIDRRACPNWAMERISIADSIEKRRDILSADLPDELEDDVRTIIINFAVLN